MLIIQKCTSSRPEEIKKKHKKQAFQREIEMMELAGRHPNVVTILGATNDSRVIVFEQAKIDLQVFFFWLFWLFLFYSSFFKLFSKPLNADPQREGAPGFRRFCIYFLRV